MTWLTQQNQQRCIKLKLKYIWPELYHSFFPKELLEAEIVENKATCRTCAKSPPQYKKKDHYEAHLKCCTFQPYIPNYAVGALLQDPKKRYRKVQDSLKSKIQRREFLLPIGMVAPIPYQIEFVKKKEKIFGRDENFLCSFYDDELNQCGAWEFRGAVCTTFYCFSSYGKKGQKFWSEVSDFQTYVEMALMEDALVHMGYSPRQLSDLLRYIKWDVSEKISPAQKKSWSLRSPLFKRLWGDHHDDIESFYRKCYTHVLNFNRKNYEEAMGEGGLQLEKNLIDLAQALQQTAVKDEERAWRL